MAFRTQYESVERTIKLGRVVLNCWMWDIQSNIISRQNVADFELHLPPQIRSFFWFHTYFTTRRLLFELGGIQNTFALPGDPTFNKNNNRYDLPSYNRLCNEFKIDPNTDFRFRKGSNNGLGEVLIYYTNEGYVKTPYDYLNKTMKFSDDGGKAEDEKFDSIY